MTRGAPDFHPWAAPQVRRQSGTPSVFHYEVSTPKDTAIAGPLSTDLVMALGFLNVVRIRIPPGHAALAGIALFADGTQLYPTTAGEFFTGDDEIIAFEADDDVPLVGGDYKMVAKTYNLDDTYGHAFLLDLIVVGYPV